MVRSIIYVTGRGDISDSISVCSSIAVFPVVELPDNTDDVERCAYVKCVRGITLSFAAVPQMVERRFQLPGIKDYIIYVYGGHPTSFFFRTILAAP